MNPSRTVSASTVITGSVDGVRFDRDGPVATITLRRPDVLTAQAPVAWAALNRYGRELPGDIRIVVVRGEAGAFAVDDDLAAAPAGADGSLGMAEGLLERLTQLPEAEAERQLALRQEAVSWLRRPDIVSIAAVDGAVSGAACALVLACDLRVVSADCLLVMAGAGAGRGRGDGLASLGGTKRLVDLVGYSRALEICITRRAVTAAEAERMGLVSAAVPASDLDARVHELVRAVLASPRDVVIEVKALLAGASRRSFDEQEAAERSAQLRCLVDLAADELGADDLAGDGRGASGDE